MGGKATVEVELAYTPQRRAQIPIPVCEVGVRGPFKVDGGFSDGKLSFSDFEHVPEKGVHLHATWRFVHAATYDAQRLNWWGNVEG